MKDLTGNDLYIGDTVVTLRPYRHDLIVGKIKSFSRINATIEFKNKRYDGNEYIDTVSRESSKIVKLISHFPDNLFKV